MRFETDIDEEVLKDMVWDMSRHEALAVLIEIADRFELNLDSAIKALKEKNSKYVSDFY